MSTPDETFRATMRGRTPEDEPNTLIVTRQSLGHAARAWLTLNGAITTTVVLTNQEAGQLAGLLRGASQASDPSERPDPSRAAKPAPVVEGMLLDMVADGFVVYCCGARAAPTALVASYEWEHYLDLVTIRDFDRITTARVPKQGTVDIFTPKVVVWAYEGTSRCALRALLDLVHPAHPDAPTVEYPAPPSLHIPRAQQRPMTIQLPSSGRALARATRLAAGMTAHGDDFGH